MSAEAAESQSEQLFEDVDKLKSWHKAYVPTRDAANVFKWGGVALHGVSTVFAAKDAWDQSEGCQDQ